MKICSMYITDLLHSLMHVNEYKFAYVSPFDAQTGTRSWTFAHLCAIQDFVSGTGSSMLASLDMLAEVHREAMVQNKSLTILSKNLFATMS